MGVYSESQIIVKCDSCLDAFIEQGSRAEVKKLARKDGWHIDVVGRVTCPKCFKGIRNET